MPFLPQIPAPLATQSFLRASHFKLGFDQQPEGSTVFSPYCTDYPPRWGTYQREPIQPPKCAGVLNQDMDNSWDTRSETCLAYPSWPLESRSAICPPASCFQMHADPRHSILTSITRESYSYPSSIPHITLNRVDKWDDSVPSGDKEKEPLPGSLYQQSYPAYKGMLPAVKAPSQHLGGSSALRGDGHNYFNTFYQSEFTGEWTPPVKGCSENVVSIVFGDPQYFQAVSEQQHAYTVQKPEGPRYDPEIASAMVHHSNIQPGDGQHRFSTIMSESYLWKQPGPPSNSGLKKNESSILLGDQDLGVPIITSTTTQDMLLPHQAKKYQLTEEELQKIKYSHLIHPWKGQRWFSTEQKDAYAEKYSGPITLATADFQGSSVPLGTMVKYQPRKKLAV
ncbi:stabilizer of axonemal microtubules 5 [Candoia aspera]|uniref:stabilizer of axonemal microtubules 5 n=1 Tax=Candoia aspera TaxID=51853 RepID=UPI002FD85555